MPMNIKTLADELRETIRKDNNEGTGKTVPKKKSDPKNALDPIIEEIRTHRLIGKEKLLIRLDDKTIFLLKQLKVTQGIDMNKIISYSLQYFLQKHPQISNHIKETLKNLEL
ncbi:Uncharacterised protein [Sphingobacterium multivorum]|uniref:Uncharacterized protein n=2 Tax=Sphingobacteriaceae TaxID=84566 RepID=A0A2X2JWM9_SPHMU|nr:Uncharacterised protein [Sphingobacterium multivorum]